MFFGKWFKKRNTRSQSKRSLEKQLDRFERIVVGSRGYGFVDWNIKQRRMVWEGGLWTYLGYTDGDMRMVSDPERFLEVIHVDDREIFMASIRHILKDTGIGEAMFRIKKKVGDYVWAEMRVGAQRDAENRVTHISGIAYDVTKIKHTEHALLLSEARHARILQASNDGIWEWSAEHRGYHFSSRCWEQLGYLEDDDVVNKGVDRVRAWWKLIHKEDVPKFDRALNDHLTKRKPFDVEYRIMGKDGQWRWIRARGQIHYNASGEPYRMSGTNMNITELKHAEERVIKSKEIAEKANRAKSEFLSNMSHELRTPLNAILGFSQLFGLDGNLTQTQIENVSEIKTAGRHLLRLIDDVLSLAKIESGRMEFFLKEIKPSRLIDECISLVRGQADERGIRIHLDLGELEHCIVSSDPIRLKQVLLNLLSNAIKYNIDDGDVYVEFALIEGETLRISIRDTGNGITEENQQQLFQPFNRLGAELSSIEGSGVGLVISRQIAQQMGGALDFVSSENKGSTFWLELRVCSEYDSEGKGKNESALEVDAKESGMLPELKFSAVRRILYVEDNPPNQRLMSQMLSRFDQIELCVVGEAFLGLYEARVNPPDIILLDINLPGMDGFEMLEIMRRDQATLNIPVIAVSANAMPHDIKKGEEAGFNQYLTKPIELQELIDVLNDVLCDSDSTQH